MNLAISSTGFKEPSYLNIEINSSNVGSINLPNGLKNLIINRTLHLLEYDHLLKLLEDIHKKLVSGGLFTIYCLDIYELAHRMHRRNITEAEYNNIMYDKGQKNSFSTLFFIEKCGSLGFKKKSVSFNDVWAKIEFVK